MRRAGYSRAAPPCLVDKGEVGMCIDGLANPLQPLGGTTSCSTHSVKRRAAEELCRKRVTKPDGQTQSRRNGEVAIQRSSFPFPATQGRSKACQRSCTSGGVRVSICADIQLQVLPAAVPQPTETANNLRLLASRPVDAVLGTFTRPAQ